MGANVTRIDPKTGKNRTYYKADDGKLYNDYRAAVSAKGSNPIVRFAGEKINQLNSAIAGAARNTVLPAGGAVSQAPIAAHAFGRFLDGKGGTVGLDGITSNAQSQKDFNDLILKAAQARAARDPKFAESGGRLSLYNYGEGSWQPDEQTIRTGKDVVFTLGEVQATPTGNGGYRIQDTYQVNERASSAHDLNPGGVIAKSMYEGLKHQAQPYQIDFNVR